MKIYRWLVALSSLSLLLSAGCATKTDVVSYDLTERAGVYILAYMADEDIRRRVEDQLTRDVEGKGMVAFPSYVDLPSVPGTTRDKLLASANDKQALAVMIVNQVVPGEDGVIDNPLRLTPNHPDIASFYEYTKTLERNVGPSGEVLAEVNLFLIQGADARLIWSGTTWSFDADGKGGAIRGMSVNISDELEQIREAMLKGLTR